MTEEILFYLFGGLAVATALGVVCFKNPISSAFALIVSFFAMAALYAMLDAHFMAVIQILVYAGAIMVLFIFVIMLLNLKPEELHERPLSKPHKWLGGVALLAFLTTVLYVLNTIKPLPFHLVDPSFGGVKRVGSVLFQDYWLPFELASLLLTVAVVGGVVLAKRKL